VLGHGFGPDELHLQRRERQADLVVRDRFRLVEVALDAVVDEGDEAGGDDDTAWVVRKAAMQLSV
jgi:hypothetical protein